VKDTTYGGKISWEDTDSDIYSRKPGDKVWITYVAHKPWISQQYWDMESNLRDSERWAAFQLATFMGGALLSIFPRRKGKIPQVQIPPLKSKLLGAEAKLHDE